MNKIIPFLLMLVFISCKHSQHEQSSSKDSLAFFKKEKKEMKQAFTALRITEIMPGGWLKSQIERDATQGLVAFFDQLTPEEMNDDLWGATRRGKIPDSLKGSWRKDLMWWRGEQQGYWWDGLLRNALLSNDKASLDKMRKVVDHLVSVQDSDGYMGIYQPDSRFSNEDGNGELWTQARGTWILLTWYEITEDEKVLNALKKQVDRTMLSFNAEKSNPFHTELYGGASHGLMYAENVAWLYRITKDVKYRDYAVWLYQAYCESERYDNDIHYSFLKDSSFNFIGHSAHSFEHLRPLLNSWYFSGAEELAQLYSNYKTKLAKVLLPSGAGFGFENMWGLMAHPDSTPVEYCGITELQLSAAHALLLTGDPNWGDLTSKLFFNAAQGARLPDCKAVTYCKTDNCNHLDGTLLGFRKHAYGKKDDRYKYSPTHLDVAECCAPQSTRCYPFYISNMWMRSEKGIAAVLYGPSLVNTSINGIPVEIKEITNYPFDDKITFEITPEKNNSFEFILRIPEWGKKNVITAPGADIKNEEGYCIISKDWKKGDKVEIVFDPSIVAKKANNGEYYLQRGEIVYALDLPSVDKKIKEWSVQGFYDQYFNLKGNLDYKLKFEGTPESAFGFKLNTQAAGNNVWVKSPYSLKGIMKSVKTSKKTEVTLVPIGSTILRQVTFPIQ